MKITKTTLAMLLGIIISASIALAAAEISSNEIGVDDEGDAPLTSQDKGICLAKWKINPGAEWGKCENGVEKLIIETGKTIMDYYTFEGPSEEEEICSFLKPSGERGCFQSESFPFFTGWNMLLAIILLTGYYTFRKTKPI